MTKRQLIDEIRTMNTTADAGFLAEFKEAVLNEYLERLLAMRQPRPCSGSEQYETYLEDLMLASGLEESIVDESGLSQRRRTTEPSEPAHAGATAETEEDAGSLAPFAKSKPRQHTAA